MTIAAHAGQTTRLPEAFSVRENANERMLRGSPSRQVLLFLCCFSGVAIITSGCT
jgi:hypothetical protein